MYIRVTKAVVGPVHWALVLVALAAFALSLFNDFFGPVGLTMIGLGAVASFFIAWRSKSVVHPSLTEELRKPSDGSTVREPIEPK